MSYQPAAHMAQIMARSAGALKLFCNALVECEHPHAFTVTTDGELTVHTDEQGIRCIQKLNREWWDKKLGHEPDVPKTFIADRVGKCIICTSPTRIGQELTWVENPFKKGTTIPVHIDCRMKQLEAAYGVKKDEAP